MPLARLQNHRNEMQWEFWVKESNEDKLAIACRRWQSEQGSRAAIVSPDVIPSVGLLVVVGNLVRAREPCWLAVPLVSPDVIPSVGFKILANLCTAVQLCSRLESPASG